VRADLEAMEGVLDLEAMEEVLDLEAMEEVLDLGAMEGVLAEKVQPPLQQAQLPNQ